MQLVEQGFKIVFIFLYELAIGFSILWDTSRLLQFLKSESIHCFVLILKNLDDNLLKINKNIVSNKSLCSELFYKTPYAKKHRI